MTEKIYNKLVRDKIPQVIKQKGAQPTVRIMEREEFVHELKTKLVEEAQEVVSAGNREKLIDELADVREVLNALYAAEEITDAEVEQARLAKLEARGGFQERIMLEKVDE